MRLPKLIKKISNDGCTEIKAIEISTDLIKIEELKSKLKQNGQVIKEARKYLLKELKNLENILESIGNEAMTIEKYTASQFRRIANVAMNDMTQKVDKLKKYKLTTKQHDCYTLYVIKGLMMDEIGVKLGMTQGSVSVHVQKARKKIMLPRGIENTLVELARNGLLEDIITFQDISNISHGDTVLIDKLAIAIKTKILKQQLDYSINSTDLQNIIKLSETLEGKERLLLKALSSLTNEQRKSYLLSRIELKSFKEIAQYMESNRSAIASRVYDARMKIEQIV